MLEFVLFILWGSALTISLYTGIEFFNAGRKRKSYYEKLMMYGFSFVIIVTFSCAQIIFRIEGIFVRYDILPNYDFLARFAYFSQALGNLFLILFLERIVNRTRYILTIIVFSYLVLIVIFPMDIVHILSNSVFLASYMIFFFIMTLLAAKFSSQDFRPISSFLLFVSTIIIGSMLLGFIYGPILYIIGHLLVLIPLKVDPIVFTRSKYYWNSFVISSIAISLVLMFYFLLINALTHFSAYIFISTFLIFSFFYIKKIMKTERENKITKDIPDIFSTFARPQNLTEEEVSISKEKRICLVCKNKLSKKIYLCSECGAFYCFNCSETLTNLENECWVCSVPFDESKPTKPLAKEETKKRAAVTDEMKKKDEFSFRTGFKCIIFN